MVHDANADLVKELRVPSDADDSAIQEALMRLFSAQVQGQVRDQTVSDAVEGQAVRAQSSVLHQALKASDSIRDQCSSAQFHSDQPESESKTTRSVQFKTSVPVSSSSSQSSHCTLAVCRSSVEIDNSLREKIYSLLRKEILYSDIIEEMESTGMNEIKRGQENTEFRKSY